MGGQRCWPLLDDELESRLPVTRELVCGGFDGTPMGNPRVDGGGVLLWHLKAIVAVGRPADAASLRLGLGGKEVLCLDELEDSP